MEPKPKPWTFKAEDRVDVINTKARYEVVSAVLTGKPLKQIAQQRRIRANSLSSLLGEMKNHAGSESFEEFMVDLVLSQPDPSLFVRTIRPPTNENLFFRHEGLLQRDPAAGVRRRRAEFLSDARVKQMYEYADRRSHMEEFVGDIPSHNFVDRWLSMGSFFTEDAGRGFLTPLEQQYLHIYTSGKSVEGVAYRLNISLSRAQKVGSQIAFKLGISTGKLVSLQCWLEAAALGVIQLRPKKNGRLISFPLTTPKT